MDVTAHESEPLHLFQFRGEFKTMYSCAFCSFVSKVNGSYEKHCIYKHNIYPCKQCEFFADSKQNLQCHKEAEHGSKPLICCEQCNFTETVAINMEKHIADKHTDNMKKVSLKINKRIDGFFQCSHCDYNYM